MDLNVVRWFHENGTPVSTDQLKLIASEPSDHGVKTYREWKLLWWCIKAGVQGDDGLESLIKDARTVCEKARGLSPK
jgi:hypothetical protein